MGVATFIIEEENKQSKRCEPCTLMAQKICLGAGSECEVKIKDYVLAAKHCIIFQTDEGFAVEDLGSGSGTYLDGRPVSGATPLESGSTLVLGTSRFKVGIDPGQLKLSRDDFRFDHARDPLIWSRSELALGRFPALYWANAGTLCVMVVAGGCFLFSASRREAILMPGNLRHGEVARDLFEDKGCDSCHVPRERAPTFACAECHQDIAGIARHPFGAWSDPAEPGVPPRQPASRAGVLACRDCHPEHRKDIIASGAQACTRCHPGGIPQLETEVPSTAVVDVSLSYSTFSHEAHGARQGNVALECGDCHVRAEEGEERLPHSQFARVTFERCGGCHDPRKERRIRGTDFPAEWHGAADDGGERCKQCHVQVFEKDMRAIRRARTGAGEMRFDVLTRSHLDEKAAHRAHPPMFKPCEDCHRRGLELGGGRPLRGRPFEHLTHLSAEREAAECRRCHDGVARAPGLADGPPFDEKACGTPCHVGGVPTVAAAPAIAPAASQTAFPHDEHLGLEGGCSECHVLGEGMPSTAPDVKDCSRCHDRTHERMGGGSCARCHVVGKEPGPGDDIVYAQARVTWSRPVDPDFDHWSPGHREHMENGLCNKCHDEAGTWGARRIEAVPIPTEGLPVCRDCHVKEGGRMHWR